MLVVYSGVWVRVLSCGLLVFLGKWVCERVIKFFMMRVVLWCCLVVVLFNVSMWVMLVVLFRYWLFEFISSRFLWVSVL